MDTAKTNQEKIDKMIETLNNNNLEIPRKMYLRYIYDPADSPENDYMDAILVEVLRSFGWYPYVSENSHINRCITFQRLYIPERKKIREKQQSFLKLFLKMTKENIFE